MISTRFVSTILILLINLSVYAQDKYDFSRFADETVEFVKQPFKWQLEDFLKLSAMIGGTYALMHIDESIRDIMNADTSWRGSIPLELGRYWGEPVPSLLLSAGLIFHGYSYNNDSNKKLGFEIAQSFIYSVSLNGALKIILGRARPSTGEDAFTFIPAQSLQNRNWSLPSGHTTIAFSLSTILADNTTSDVLKAAAYLPAFVTALSRVNYNRHWVSDVFLGGLSGYFIAKYVTNLHKEENRVVTGEMNQTPLFSIKLLF